MLSKTELELDVTTQNGWEDLKGDVSSASKKTNMTEGTMPNGFTAMGMTTSPVSSFEMTFHTEHWLKLDSEHFPHVHFTGATGFTAGSVRFQYEISFCKGHGLSYWQTLPTMYSETICTESNRGMVSEVSVGFTEVQIQPDSEVMIRVTRLLAVDDSTADSSLIFVTHCDIHQEKSQMATINRLPNFYGE